MVPLLTVQSLCTVGPGEDALTPQHWWPWRIRDWTLNEVCGKLGHDDSFQKSQAVHDLAPLDVLHQVVSITIPVIERSQDIRMLPGYLWRVKLLLMEAAACSDRQQR